MCVRCRRFALCRRHRVPCPPPHVTRLSTLPPLGLLQEVFDDWRIESQSDNCILIELALPNFLEAMGGALKASAVVQMKLTKRNGQPVLCVETRFQDEMDVVHDIKVVVMRASDYEYYRPPDVPQPSVQLELPESRSLKNVVDKLRNISRSVYLKGEMVGNLTIEADTDAVGIRSFFTNLHPRFDSLDEELCQDNQTTMKVDTKKLSMVLQGYNTLSRLRDRTIILCMIEGHSLVLHILVNTIGTLTFYVGVMEMDDDDAHVDPIEDGMGGGDDDDMA